MVSCQLDDATLACWEELGVSEGVLLLLLAQPLLLRPLIPLEGLLQLLVPQLVDPGLVLLLRGAVEVPEPWAPPGPWHVIAMTAGSEAVAASPHPGPLPLLLPLLLLLLGPLLLLVPQALLWLMITSCEGSKQYCVAVLPGWRYTHTLWADTFIVPPPPAVTVRVQVSEALSNLLGYTAVKVIWVSPTSYRGP